MMIARHDDELARVDLVARGPDDREDDLDEEPQRPLGVAGDRHARAGRPVHLRDRVARRRARPEAAAEACARSSAARTPAAVGRRRRGGMWCEGSPEPCSGGGPEPSIGGLLSGLPRLPGLGCGRSPALSRRGRRRTPRSSPAGSRTPRGPLSISAPRSRQPGRALVDHGARPRLERDVVDAHRVAVVRGPSFDCASRRPIATPGPERYQIVSPRSPTISEMRW